MTANSALSLFCLNTSRAYAERVAAHLGVALSAHEERDFEDGEHKIRALDSVRGRDVFVVQSLYGEPHFSVNDKLCRLLFFIGSLRDAGATRIGVAAPYLCYARKDQRTQPQDPITTRYLAGLFEAVGTDWLLSFDVHNSAAFDNAFRCRTRQLRALPLFVDYFRARLDTALPWVVVAPDVGAVKRTEAFRRELAAVSAAEPDHAFMEKYRSGGKVSGGTLVGDVRGKIAIVLDDLISSGTTLLRAGKACRAAGAELVYAAATHGLFMAGSEALFSDGVFDGIAVGDTVPAFRLASDHAARLDVVDTTGLLAEAVGEWGWVV